MGVIYRENVSLVKDYPEETRLAWRKALIIPGQAPVEVNAAALSADEAEAILLKLDMLAYEKNNEAIAGALVAEADSVITLVRAVKKAIGGAGSFQGIQGAGQALDLVWLRAKHIGGSLLNKAGTALKGIYGQANSTVVWLYSTFTAGTSVDYLPSQGMDDYAGVIHIGAIEGVVSPHLDAITFTITGRTSPAQPLGWNIRKSFNEMAVPFVKFELPVMVLPLYTQQITVMPTVSNADSKMQLISLLCAQAKDLTL
jgi:hypothetical protein